MKGPLLPLLLLAVCPLLALCGCEGAKYRYTIAVRTPPVPPRPGDTAGSLYPQRDAKIRVQYADGVKEVALRYPTEAVTINVTERGGPIEISMRMPRGLSVRVTKEGYKPWAADYRLFGDFVRESPTDFRRLDVILMQPTASPQPTTRTAGAP